MFLSSNRRWCVFNDAVRYVDSRTGKKVSAVQDRGIGQGNPLSALIQNVALAPLFRKLKNRCGVEVLAYLDDIYVMGETYAQVWNAFNALNDIAHSSGFTNVRGLGDGEKASRIVYVPDEKLLLLNTHEISMDMIGLADVASRGSKTQKGKLTELREQIVRIEKEEPQVQITPRLIRKEAGSEALTKRWMRMEGLLPSTSSNGSKSKTQYTKSTLLPHNPVELEADPDTHLTCVLGNGIQTIGCGGDRVQDTDHAGDSDSRIQMEQQVDSTGDFGTIGSGHSNGYPYPSTIEDTAVNDSTETASRLDINIHGLVGGQSVKIDDQVLSSIPVKNWGSNTIPRACTKKDTVGLDLLSSSVSKPIFPILQIPQIRDALLNGQKIRLENHSKGKVLDLRGLERILNYPSEEWLFGCLQKLLRMGREDRQVRILFGSSDAWAYRPGIAGNRDDSRYEQVGDDDPCGFGIVRTLRLKTRKPRKIPQEQPRVGPAPQGMDLIFRKPKKVEGQPKTWDLHVRVGKVSRTERIYVRNSNRNVAQVEVTTKAVETLGVGKYVAFPLVGPIRGLVNPDRAGWRSPSQSELAEMIETLEKNHGWKFIGGWAIGIPTKTQGQP